MDPSVQDWLAAANAHYEAERWSAAGEAFERALALDDALPEAWYRLGNVRQEQRRDEAAAGCFQRVLVLDPSHAKAWNNLGVTWQRLGEEALAIEAYRVATQHDASLVQAQRNLAHLLAMQGEDAAAQPVYERALALDPSHAETWYSLGRCRHRLGLEGPATAAYRTALEKDPALARPYANLADLACAKGDLALADRLLSEGLARQPADPVMTHMRSAVRGETTALPPAGYVETYFDRLAYQFDRHLLQDLEYRVPQALGGIVLPALAAFEPARVVDLGCGTGLVGAALQGSGAELVGIDLSAEMLERAAKRGVYKRLVRGELTEELQRVAPESVHAVLSADVFIYVGDLDAVFAAAARALVPGGLFAFSVEEIEGEGYRLQLSGRYAHSVAYLRALAARHGLEERSFEHARLRREGSGYSSGWLALLVKRAAGDDARA